MRGNKMYAQWPCPLCGMETSAGIYPQKRRAYWRCKEHGVLDVMNHWRYQETSHGKVIVLQGPGVWDAVPALLESGMACFTEDEMLALPLLSREAQAKAIEGRIAAQWREVRLRVAKPQRTAWAA